MNHQKTRLTSLMALWDPLDALLDSLAPPGPPHEPPRTPKQVSWPHTDSRSPRLHYKSSEDPSNVTADPVEHLTPPP